ncbi:MAG TPA: hypothetical protein VFH99_03875 [Candidatus Saccharimonadales bacterium]|nr:hypothetical protein [Candidatus Saccharimonadales bacterium]
MKKLHNWHQSKLGLLIFSLIELGVAYGFASLAIDRGGLWWYLLALIFLVGALQNLFKLIEKFINGKDKAK